MKLKLDENLSLFEAVGGYEVAEGLPESGESH